MLKIWIQIVEETETEMVEETALHWTYKFFDAVLKNVQEHVSDFPIKYLKCKNVICNLTFVVNIR
jgi:hypothetical protein